MGEQPKTWSTQNPRRRREKHKTPSMWTLWQRLYKEKIFSRERKRKGHHRRSPFETDRLVRAPVKRKYNRDALREGRVENLGSARYKGVEAKGKASLSKHQNTLLLEIPIPKGWIIRWRPEAHKQGTSQRYERIQRTQKKKWRKGHGE